MTARLPDWESRLAVYMRACRAREFEWGALDCALFIAGAVEAMTGVDPAAAYRGRYTTREGAAQALRNIGEGTLAKTIGALFTECPTSHARRGDLVWHDGAIGVCMGEQALFIGAEGEREGLVRIPRGQWEGAHRV